MTLVVRWSALDRDRRGGYGWLWRQDVVGAWPGSGVAAGPVPAGFIRRGSGGRGLVLGHEAMGVVKQRP